MMITNATLNQRRRGLAGCGMGALSLAMNKSNFLVGEAPGYSIAGAQAAQPVFWSSTKNGLPTGENLSGYGHTTDAQGVWAGVGNQWTNEQQGAWTKTATVGGESATVAFQVMPQSGGQPTTTGTPVIVQTTTPAAQPTTNGWLTGDFDFGGYKIPKVAAYAAAAFVVYTMFGRKR